MKFLNVPEGHKRSETFFRVNKKSLENFSLLKKSFVFLILLGIIFSTFISGCSNLQSKQETIKIVASFPMREINVGQDIVNGIKLAFEEADYSAGNYKIELIVEDGGDETGTWQASIEREIAKRAVEDPDVMVYLGTYNSGAAKVSIPITNQGGLVQISPGNTWPGLTKPGFFPGEPGIFYPTGARNYFRVCPNDIVQGPAGAVWAKEMGFQNVYIFDDGESYGRGIANIFEEKAIELGLNILGHITLDKKSQDFTEELSKIKDLDLDIIYFGGVTPNGAVPLVKGIKELGITAKFMGPDGIMEQAFIDQAGDAAQGTYVTVVGIPTKELKGNGKEFYENYLKQYTKEPGAFSGFGYEATKAALLAIERAGVKNRAKILEEVSKIKNYDGLFGTWSFDKYGDTTLTIVSGNIVKNKSFVFEKLLSSK